jgi:hypothetical protein
MFQRSMQLLQTLGLNSSQLPGREGAPGELITHLMQQDGIQRRVAANQEGH